MRIIHITTVHPSDDVRIFHKMCRTLAQAGLEVTLIAQHANDEVVDGVRILAIPASTSRTKRTLLGGFRAFRLARRESADLFHFHDPELLPWAVLFRLTGRCVVFDMHENLPASILTKSWIPLFARRAVSKVFYLFERLAFRVVPVIFAEHSYQKYYKGVAQAQVILNLPVHDELMKFPEVKSKEFSLAYVGRVSELRGSIRTLEALLIAKDTLGDINFDCVGGGSKEHIEELRRYCDQNKLNKVTIHGRKSPVDAWSIANHATVGLATLLPIPNYLESYPTKMFEYMALGIPVLVSDFDLYRSIINDTGAGRVVDSTDPIAISKELEWFQSHPDDALEMGRRGRQAVINRYNWQREFQKLLAFYRKIVAN